MKKLASQSVITTIRKVRSLPQMIKIQVGSALNKKLFANDAWPVVEALDLPDDAYDDGAIAAHAVKSLARLAKKKKPSS